MTNCTIAIPVFNRRKLVRRALESALEQDIDGLEIIIVDNCSADGTFELLNSYDDPRIKLYRNEENIGLFQNFNRCLDLSNGRYVRLLCSDDRLEPGCLKQEIEIMEQNADCVLLCTRGRRVNDNGQVLGMQASQFPAGVYLGRDAIFATLWVFANHGLNPLNYPSGMLIRQTAIHDRFRTDWRMAADLDFFFGILSRGNLAVVNRVGCEITEHPQQEGAAIASSRPFFREIVTLAEARLWTTRDACQANAVMRQFSALCFAYAVKKHRSLQKEVYDEYVALSARLAGGLLGYIVPMIRLFGYRILRKLGRPVFLPVSPIRPL